MVVCLHLCFICEGQEYEKKEIEFYASFSREPVFMEDSIELNLYYKNNSNSYVDLYPKAIIGLSHNHKEFISYESAAKIVYRLNNSCNYDSVVRIEPKGLYKYTFDLKVDSSFFYKGENNILVFYHLYDRPINNDNRKKDKRKPRLTLWSPVVRINVIYNLNKSLL